MSENRVYPVKPGDWVSDGSGVGIVKDIYWDGHENCPLADITIYDRTGRKVGRESPAEGGPTKFEPAVPLAGWKRIPRPSFPVEISRIPVEGEPGRFRLGYHFGRPLPDREWSPSLIVRPASVRKNPDDGPLIEALRAIAAGHNDARECARGALLRAGVPIMRA